MIASFYSGVNLNDNFDFHQKLCSLTRIWFNHNTYSVQSLNELCFVLKTQFESIMRQRFSYKTIRAMRETAFFNIPSSFNDKALVVVVSQKLLKYDF